MARENLRKTGSEMEGEAAAYLEAQGVHILERNYRTREAEIDLIGMQGRTLVFVEVKARKMDGKSGAGAEAVVPSKQMRICRCADFYMHSKGIDPYSTRIRFDVIEIRMESRTERRTGADSAETVHEIMDEKQNQEQNLHENQEQKPDEEQKLNEEQMLNQDREFTIRWIRDAFPYIQYKRTRPSWRVF